MKDAIRRFAENSSQGIQPETATVTQFSDSASKDAYGDRDYDANESDTVDFSVSVLRSSKSNEDRIFHLSGDEFEVDRELVVVTERSLNDLSSDREKSDEITWQGKNFRLLDVDDTGEFQKLYLQRMRN